WLMMSLWDALRMNMMISYQELVRTFLSSLPRQLLHIKACIYIQYFDAALDIPALSICRG
ncbi:hypothetical protein ACR2W6_26490, partial [Klebsiella pneumoniae]